MRLLGAFPTPEAVEFLTGILKDEGQEVSFRYEAAISLGTTRDRHAAETMLGMTRVPSKDLRRGILWGLGRTGDPRAVPVLFQAVKNHDEDVETRQAAAIGLGRSRVPNAVRYLLSAVEDASENQRVRQSMMASLAFTGDPVAMRRLFKELKGGDIHLQFAAALALPYISDRKAVGALVERIEERQSRGPPVCRTGARKAGRAARGSPSRRS